MAPRWRLPLLLLGLVSLAFGVAGGLSRLSPGMSVSPMAVALHGPLMVSAFFGTVISLERAVALDRLWGHAAPLCAGSGGLALLLGFPMQGFALMALAAALLLASSAVLARRRPGLETATLLAGAAAWLVGNVSVLAGLPAVPWWIAFFALTIGAERLERARREAFARSAFLVVAAALLFAPVQPWILGLALILLALWLVVFDTARAGLRESGGARYVAVCLLAGYAWLAIGGALIAAAMAYDAALHAVFVGFVFSMVFGHAPVPYGRSLYAPLVLLHASLVVRALVSTELGAWGNAAALALFALVALSRAWSGRRRPRAPAR